MNAWRRALVRTNYQRDCANPHQQLEYLCEVLLLSRSFHSQPVDSCTLRERRHNRYLFVDTRFFRINPFHRIRQNNTCIELHPLVPFHASRLSESGLHIGRAGRDVMISLTVLLLQHFLLVDFAQTSHPHLKKPISLMFPMPLLEQMRDILERLNSFLCGSGLFRRSFGLFLRFIIGS